MPAEGNYVPHIAPSPEGVFIAPPPPFWFPKWGRAGEGVLTRAIIFANGDAGGHVPVRAVIRPSDLLIAADGGAHHALALGLTPHLVIGDLDSLSLVDRAQLERAGARFEIHPAHKNETDLELAVRAAQRDGADEIVILAALGGRWDQTFANALLLAHPDFATLDVRLVDGASTLWVTRTRSVVRGAIGDTVSLLPLAGEAAGVTLTGFEYPLTDATLHFAETRGVSNTLVVEEATITLQRGILLVIHTRSKNEK